MNRCQQHRPLHVLRRERRSLVSSAKNRSAATFSSLFLTIQHPAPPIRQAVKAADPAHQSECLNLLHPLRPIQSA